MTAETDLLPLPRVLQHPSDKDLADFVQHYARACVSSATEALRAEVDNLAEGWAAQSCRANREEARAERLAGALREAREYVVSELAAERDKFAGYEHCSNIASIEADLAKIDAALEQETTNG